MDTALYTTFADNHFGYDCHGCGLCCKGHGILMDMQRNGLLMLKRFPQLRLFSRSATRLQAINNLPDACWFLDPDTLLCRIETTYSKTDKPLLCSLFPYKFLGTHQGQFVVTLNYLCPLMLDAPNTRVWISSDNFRQELAIHDSDYLVTHSLPINRPFIDLALEEQIKAICFQRPSPDYIAIVAESLSLYGSSTSIDDLEKTVRSWREFVGLPKVDSKIRAAVSTIVASVTPHLRISATGQNEQSRALSLLAVFFISCHSATMSGRITPKQVVVLSKTIPAVKALPYLEMIPTLSFSQRSPASHFSKFELHIRDLGRKLQARILRNNRKRLTLKEIVNSLGIDNPDTKWRTILSLDWDAMGIKFEPRDVCAVVSESTLDHTTINC